MSFMSFMSFDRLRLLAAWFVIVGHSYELLLQPEPFHRVTGLDTLGGVGVVMFFAISGYWVTQSRLRSPSVGTFLWNRALRIFPALWTVVLLSAFVFAPLLSRFSVAEVFASPTTYDYLSWLRLAKADILPGVFEDNPMQPGFNGALWTLPVEAKCYAAVAALGVAPRRWLPPCLAAFCFAYGVIAGKHFGDGLFRVWYFAVDSYVFLKLIGAFLIGAVIAIGRFEKQLRLPVALFPLVLFVCVAAFGNLSSNALWLPFVAALSVATLALGHHATIARSRSLNRANDYSYGLYLYAFPIQQAIISFAPTISPAQLIAMTTLLTFGFAMVSWHWIEKPFLSAKGDCAPQRFLALAATRARTLFFTIALTAFAGYGAWHSVSVRWIEPTRATDPIPALGRLETSTPDFRSGQSVRVHGWLLHPAGIRRARLFYGEKPLSLVELRLRRPDVLSAQRVAVAGALHSGFAVTLPAVVVAALPPNAALTLRIELHNGRVTSLPDWVIP